MQDDQSNKLNCNKDNTHSNAYELIAGKTLNNHAKLMTTADLKQAPDRIHETTENFIKNRYENPKNYKCKM